MALEQTLAVEVTGHAVANRVLEFVPVGSREMGGLVELTRIDLGYPFDRPELDDVMFPS